MEATTTPKRLLYPIEEVREIVPLATSTIYKLAGAGRFPSPIKVGRRNMWRHRDLIEWIDSQASA